MKILFCIFGLAITFSQGYAQVIFGVNDYTQYHVGNLPIIISVPHGGLVAPASIPDRTCNNPTTVTDGRTIELARQIDTSLFKLTGCHPHLIICNLKRTKIDCNRNIADGACGNSEAEIAWQEFHNFIDTAQSLAQQISANKAIYIDLHGHGKPTIRLELGYGLTGAMLNNSDSVLNTEAYISTSSIKNLVSTNVNRYTHSQLLRGANSLGTMFANAGFPAVPSQQTPSPDSTAYFNGGYNTFNHTCIAQGNMVNGLQIECDSEVRASYSNRKKFADSAAVILLRYMLIHQNLNLVNNCISGIIEDSDKDIILDIIPNPVKNSVEISIGKIENNYVVEIINALGEIVFKAKNENRLSVENLPKGTYFVQVTCELRNQIFVEQKNIRRRKIIIQ